MRRLIRIIQIMIAKEFKMMVFKIFSILVIAGVCYCLVENMRQGCKLFFKNRNIAIGVLAFIGGTLSFTISILLFDDIANFTSFGFVFIGAVCGGFSVIANNYNQTLKRKRRLKKIVPLKYRDNSPPKYFITGDKHRNFDSLIDFCEVNHLRRKDVIIILGDSGFNYYGDERDDALKRKLQNVEVTLFCLHGNKENRPENIPTYGIQTVCGGVVYYEPKYPNIFFAKDGEIYNFNGKEFIVCGGAHSVDKIRCISEDYPYWDDEMPSAEIKLVIENALRDRGNKIYGFLTHTCPISCLPKEMFISTRRKIEDSQKEKAKKKIKKKDKRYPLDIDRSTEMWLESLKCSIEYNEWYCGHYHVGKTFGNVRMLHDEILPFCTVNDNDEKGGDWGGFKCHNCCSCACRAHKRCHDHWIAGSVGCTKKEKI